MTLMEPFWKKMSDGDWVSAGATLIAGLLAIVGVVVTLLEMRRSTANQIKQAEKAVKEQLDEARKQTHEQIEATREVARFEAYLRFDERWNSLEMTRRRHRLLELIFDSGIISSGSAMRLDDTILAKNRGLIGKVIDFFENMGAGLRYGTINRGMIENGFSDVIVAYWLCVGDAYSKYINHPDERPSERKDTGVYYEEFRRLAVEMIEKYAETATSESVMDTLEDERALTMKD